MDPTLSWPGYAAGSTTQTTITPADLYDCDKSKGINAIVLDISATWCQPCQQEAQEFDPQFAKSWSAEGVVVMTIMYQDGNQNPATAQTALDWINQFSLKHVAVVAGPTFDFVPSTGAIPTLALVDPRTMKILSVTLNDLVGDPSVDQLAQKNK
jgi:thiol-disulfide isomerase/thioredoxin